MLSLEHLKLLAPKAQQFEMGTGGVPDITFHEVADALGSLSSLARRYARYKYANDESNYKFIKFNLMLYAFKRTVEKDVRIRSRAYWSAVVDMALEFHAHGKAFGIGRKARRAHRRRWTRGDEDNFIVILNVLDQAEYDLRRAFREWNEKNNS